MTSQREYVMVPREPTAQMLRDAWADANDEDAAGVWRSMIASYEGSLEDVSSGKSDSDNG